MSSNSFQANKEQVNKQIYEDLFRYAAIPAAVFDTAGHCLFANRSFNIQLGYSIDQPCPVILTEIFEDEQEGQTFIHKLNERSILRRYETRLITQNKRGISVLLSARLFTSDENTFFQVSFTDISRLKELETTIRKDNARTISIMENISSGLFFVNSDGILSNINLTLQEMLGIDENFIKGKTYQTFLAALLSKCTEPEIIQPRIANAIANLDQYPRVEFTIKTNIDLHYELALFPVRDTDGLSVGWGGLVTDITDLKQQIEWKLELLSILSHDIRSPLATLKGHISMLQDNYRRWGEGMVQDFLDTINRSVDKLSHQVDRNLALTRVEGGELGLRPQNIDLVECVEQAIASVTEKRENVVIDLVYDDDLARTRADPARIEEVIINLLDNAIRYNPHNEHIQIELHANNSWLVFTIRDLGKGIPQKMQKTIFDKYVRVDEDEGGTGLGLYISRKIIEAHGGQIRVQSPLAGKTLGTEFTFTLPIAYSASRKKEVQKTVLPAVSLDRKDFTILIVEDEPDYLVMMKTILVEAGYQVETVTNGIAALDVINISSPDLVLLDWVLPQMDGLSVCQGIRRYSNVPIIVVTSCTEQEELLTAFDAGADDYLIKPFDKKELFARINALLRREGTLHNASKPNRFNAGGLLIDFDTHEVWLHGKNLFLPRTEYEILEYMAQHRNQLMTYNQIIESINALMVDKNRSALYVHISRLRKKIEPNPQDPTYIVTRWGIGYIFMPYA